MLVQEHIRQLIKLAKPEDRAQYLRYYSEITPVKYGQTLAWHDAGDYGLARYQIPAEASFHVVLRVECYTTNLTAGDPDLLQYLVPPPGFAFWELRTPNTGTVVDVLTDRFAPVQRLLDADEYMFVEGGYDLFLIGTLSASPDGETRSVRTLVYAYNIGPELGSILGRSEMVIPSQ